MTQTTADHWLSRVGCEEYDRARGSRELDHLMARQFPEAQKQAPLLVELRPPDDALPGAVCLNSDTLDVPVRRSF